MVIWSVSISNYISISRSEMNMSRWDKPVTSGSFQVTKNIVASVRLKTFCVSIYQMHIIIYWEYRLAFRNLLYKQFGGMRLSGKFRER